MISTIVSRWHDYDLDSGMLTIQHRLESHSCEVGITLRLCDLRHGHITELLSGGIPYKQIQEIAGHSSDTITKDGHFMVGEQKKSMQKWESTRFVKTGVSEAGTPGATRTPDKRFRNVQFQTLLVSKCK